MKRNMELIKDVLSEIEEFEEIRNIKGYAAAELDRHIHYLKDENYIQINIDKTEGSDYIRYKTAKLTDKGYRFLHYLKKD